MGAVNCVVRRDERWIGENTDGKGFVSSLRELTDPAGKRVVMLGAGGAARAIGVELALAGASHVTVVNRSAARGRELHDLLAGKVTAAAPRPFVAEFAPWQGDYVVPSGTDIVVNATSIGLYPDIDARLGLDPDTLAADMVVADVIPNPPRTRLVRDALARGCRVIDGLGMLVAQGVIGVEYWTGITPDAGVMRRALEEVFAE
jgi:shikimate dehydrogenase